MPQQSEKRIPTWLTIDLLTILVSFVIIEVSIWIAPQPANRPECILCSRGRDFAFENRLTCSGITEPRIHSG